MVAGIIAGNIVWTGFTQARYPARILGRVSTSMQVFNYGAIPAGALVAGTIASHLGVRATLWIMLGGLVLSTGVLLLGPLPRLRDLPAEPSASARQQAERDEAPRRAVDPLVPFRIDGGPGR
jgi:hypothetical protein